MSPFGVPWPNRMSIEWRGWIARRRSLEALRHKIKHGLDLLASHVELLHHFLDAQIFEILDHGRNRQAGPAEDPCAADLAGDAFNGGTLGPVERCHSLTC